MYSPSARRPSGPGWGTNLSSFLWTGGREAVSAGREMSARTTHSYAPVLSPSPSSFHISPRAGKERQEFYNKSAAADVIGLDLAGWHDLSVLSGRVNPDPLRLGVL